MAQILQGELQSPVYKTTSNDDFFDSELVFSVPFFGQKGL